MPADVAIRVEEMGKRFYRGALRPAHSSLKDLAMSALSRPFGGGTVDEDHETFWALKDVSFEVRRGEALGIVGRNGCGKSTLLKILARITPPTEGYAQLRGRVAALLEVGTGFQQELTGRENIYLNGAILGMRRGEIEARFDEIVEFSEMGAFLDTPVKRYSSGMYVRLAFAVAAHLDPDILFADEVLAVGDQAFQQKCLGKMSASVRSGRTVLFVSHSAPAVAMLCDRAVYLHEGRVRMIGETGPVLERYQRDLATRRPLPGTLGPAEVPDAAAEAATERHLPREVEG